MGTLAVYLQGRHNCSSSHNRVHSGVWHGGMTPFTRYCHIELGCCAHDGTCVTGQVFPFLLGRNLMKSTYYMLCMTNPAAVRTVEVKVGSGSFPECTQVPSSVSSPDLAQVIRQARLSRAQLRVIISHTRAQCEASCFATSWQR